MPRRIPDYATQFTDWNMVSSIGGVRLRPRRSCCSRTSSGSASRGRAGRRTASGRGAHGLEWELPSPPPYHSRGPRRRRTRSSRAVRRTDAGIHATMTAARQRAATQRAVCWRAVRGRFLLRLHRAGILVRGMMNERTPKRAQPHAAWKLLAFAARRVRVRLRAGAAVQRAVRRSPATATSSKLRAGARSSSKQPDETARSRSSSSPSVPTCRQLGVPTRSAQRARCIPGKLYHRGVLSPVTSGRDSVCAGGAQHRSASVGDAVFPQDRVLLLHAAVLQGATRSAQCRCVSSSTRRCPRHVDSRHARPTPSTTTPARSSPMSEPESNEHSPT